ncbi:shikimate kinase [Pontibacter cellulosilyticus]|uniref:Shikimate kinase n=1 Tax=Pontibacter cellulosilyticus TaxID=1720253 RepID=A0A923NDD0_9BACT|nr:shikimate kinase [Pontibacter cellulosilyticus]MBC5994865.1 shikimate kinase [Pontibacter cellulosilyticus]
MLVFLVGMMGSGKSTLGRQLAQMLGYTFIDLDEYIEQREQKTIPAIFADQGENTFRQKERDALQAVVQEYADAVVATGGGTPCFFDNINFMNQQGKTVFLAVPPEAIVRRLTVTDLNTRPLLAGKSEAEITSFMVKTLAHRVWFYQQAKYTAEGAAITASQLAQLLNQ